MTTPQPAAPAMTDEEIERLRAGLEGTSRGGWKAAGYVVIGDWHASGPIARVSTGKTAFADTKHIARCSPDAIARLLSRLTAEIAARKEAEDRAQAWHGMCQAIATILGLSEPELGFPAIVRAYDEEQRARAVAAEARVAELVAVLKPFADACQQTTEMDHAGKLVAIVIVVGHLRRARTALGGSQ